MEIYFNGKTYNLNNDDIPEELKLILYILDAQEQWEKYNDDIHLVIPEIEVN